MQEELIDCVSDDFHTLDLVYSHRSGDFECKSYISKCEWQQVGQKVCSVTVGVSILD